MANSLESLKKNVIHQNQYEKEGKCLMLFLTFWLLFGKAKSNKASMADAKRNEKFNVMKSLSAAEGC
ncbi:MAG: hypothetical protein IPK08_12140 [Bacteroidetes bacterium]|nr:hypothetical protein [Bacteroidota bacterium]